MIYEMSQKLFRRRRELEKSEVSFHLEEFGEYARLDEVDEAISTVWKEMCDLRGLPLTKEGIRFFKCPGKVYISISRDGIPNYFMSQNFCQPSFALSSTSKVCRMTRN